MSGDGGFLSPVGVENMAQHFSFLDSPSGTFPPDKNTGLMRPDPGSSLELPVSRTKRMLRGNHTFRLGNLFDSIKSDLDAVAIQPKGLFSFIDDYWDLCGAGFRPERFGNNCFLQ